MPALQERGAHLRFEGAPVPLGCRNKGCGERRGYRFSVITQTIFENTKIPLKIWFKVAFLILTRRKGSALYRSIASSSERNRRTPITQAGTLSCAGAPR